MRTAPLLAGRSCRVGAARIPGLLETLAAIWASLAAVGAQGAYVKWTPANGGLDLGSGSGVVEVSVGGEPLIAYAIVDGTGLWKSTDRGLGWTRLQGDSPCLAKPYSVAVSPSNGNIVYLACASPGAGLWRSTDGGATWSRLAGKDSGLASDDVEWVTLSEAFPELVLVGHREGAAISFSRDGGASWSTGALGRTIRGQIPFVIDDARWLVAGRGEGGGVVFTEDGGRTWAAASGRADYFTGPLPVVQVGECFFASSHHGTNKSVDGGRTWTYAMERHARVVGSIGTTLFREDREAIRGENARLLAVVASYDFANSWEDVTGALIDLVPPNLRPHITIQNSVDPFAHVRMATCWASAPGQRIFFLGLGKAGLYRGEIMKTKRGPDLADARATPVSLAEGDLRTPIRISVMASARSGAVRKVYAYLAGLGRGELELFDDGRHGDGEPGDRVYANSATVGRGARPGDKTVGIIAEDDSGRVGSTSVRFKLSGAAERMIVWDGDKFAHGGGWVAPQEGFNSLKPQNEEVHEGNVALELRCDVPGGWMGGGWNWHGWYPEGSGTDIRAYRNLSFWVKIEGEIKRGFNVALNCSTHAKAGGGTAAVPASDYVVPADADLTDGQWHEVVIPLVDLLAKPGIKFDASKAWGINFDTWAPGPGRCSIYIDQIGFDNRLVRPHSVWVTEPEEREAAPLGKDAPEVTATADLLSTGTPISPFIYGASMGDRKVAVEAGLTTMRAGGNPVTPFNWRKGFSSKGSDWYYQNDGLETPPEKTWLATFHRENKEHGLETYLTIPMMGRVAKDGVSVAFDVRRYPDQESWAGKVQPTDRLPHAGNGRQFVKGDDGQYKKDRDGRPVLRDIEPNPDDTSVEMTPEEQTEFLRFLIEKMGYGTAEKGGVKYVALDNEPFLWHSTHRGMRPAGCSYDELWERTRTYASLYKRIDPSVKIACGTSWGWTAYFYSGLDAQLVSRGEGTWDAPPDFTAHGKVPVIKWLLTRLREHERETGVRLCDILDVHFYPQTGIYMSGTPGDPKVMEARVQETRVLWDPSWKDPSWMGAETGKVIRLVRLMKEWIAECNPGMQLAIGEYNFGGERDVSGGVAQAELLGVFAREGVAFAYLWLFPHVNSPQYFAFKMFRNPDGKHTEFGDRYLGVSVSAPDDVSVHAARDSASGRLTFILVNKRAAKGAKVKLNLNRRLPEQKVVLYEYSAADRFCIGRQPERTVGGNAIVVDLPPMSVVRFDAKP